MPPGVTSDGLSAGGGQPMADALGPTGGGSRASVPGAAAGGLRRGVPRRGPRAGCRSRGTAAGVPRLGGRGPGACGGGRGRGVLADGNEGADVGLDEALGSGGGQKADGLHGVSPRFVDPEPPGSVVLTSESCPGVTRTVRATLQAGSSRRQPLSARSGRGLSAVSSRSQRQRFAVLRQPDRAFGSGLAGREGTGSRAGNPLLSAYFIDTVWL
jgi:hypothetical protein